MDGARKALIVAIDDYADPGLRLLRAPASDARALAAVLRDPEIGAFEVQTLLNEPSYVVNVAVEEFFADRRPDDLLVLHFSCHGIKDEDGELHFATSNTVLGRLGATAVAAEFVSRRMSRSRSRRIVLLLDCCYAGAFERGLFARATSDMGIEQQFGGRGRAVITASSAMEYAFESGELTETRPMGPSVFTRALVAGLETGEADRDQDGLVGLDELYDYVYDKVRETTPNQTPGKWTFGLEGELYIARRSRPVTTPAPLPRELEQAIENPLAGVRAGAVQELLAVLRGSHAGQALAARVALERLAHDDSRSVAAAATAALGGQASPPAMATSAPADATPVVEAAPALASQSPVQATATSERPDTPIVAPNMPPPQDESVQHRHGGPPRSRKNARRWMLVSVLLAVAAALVAVAVFLSTGKPAPIHASSPRGFQVLSMTFVSNSVYNSQSGQSYEGFALGTVGCRSGRCLALQSSQNGSAHWTQLTAPTRSAAHLGACQAGRQCVQQIRFATPLIGYAYGPSLLMTTDGGQKWNPIKSTATSLEAAEGNVVWVASKSTGCSRQRYSVDWAPRGSFSAQPVSPQPSLMSTVCPPVLYRQHYRLVLVGYGNPADGVPAPAMIYQSPGIGGAWTRVPDACGKDGGYASAVALADPDFLVLLCQQRLHESAGAAGRAWVLVSSNGGGSFGRAAYVPSPVGPPYGKISYQLAAASGNQLLVAETGAHGTKLLLTQRGGLSWKTTLSMPGKGTVILVGFEDPSTGTVAQGTTVWTTTNGGGNWTPDHFK